MVRFTLIFAALFACAAAAWAPMARAQAAQTVARELGVQLTAIDRLMGRQGFRRVGQAAPGMLTEGSARFVPLRLAAGAEYRIVAVCDRACGDLDLRLFDQNGGLITEEVGPGTAPMVTSVPRWTGSFRLQVLMPSCGVASGCFYALIIYGR